MNASWLLRGKTLPPKQWVPMHARERLIKRLTSGRARKLTLIDAPAGFGKTTLLAQWRDRLLKEQTRVAWLTLDADDTGERLAAYVALSLDAAGLDMSATGILTDDPRGLPAAAAAVAAILDALARDAGETFMIFDDLERLTHLEAQRQLDTLIRYAPDNLHIAVAGRANPGLSLAHLSLMGQVNHIDATQLKFTSAETRAYLHDLGTAIDSRAVAERAEGWPVAVQIFRSLAMQSPVSGESIGGDALPAGLAEAYLTEQLVRRLTLEQRSFLCDISLLEEVSLSLADHVRESESAPILRELDYLSALMPRLDGAASHLRMHPLVREHFAVLANVDRQRCALIHRRAACWFAEAQKLPTALRHAVAAGDKMLIGSLIIQAGGVSIWIRQGMVVVVEANRLIDEEMIGAMPRLGLLRTIVLIKQSRLHEARAQYERITAATHDFSVDPAVPDATALRREGLFILSMLVIYCCLPLSETHLLSLDKGLHDPDADDVELAHHKTVLCVTYLQNGNFDAARRYGEEAAAHFRACGSIYGTIFIDFHLGTVAMARGDAQQAAQLYEKGRRKSRRHFTHDVGLRLIGDVLTAELDLERNALLNVKRRLTRVIERLHDAEAWFEIYVAAYSAAADVYLVERGLDETLAFLEQASSRAAHLRLAKLGPILDALRVTSLTLLGDPQRALHVAERSSINFAAAGLDEGAGAAWREVEAVSTAWVRLMLRLGRYTEALDTAARALAFARTRGLSRMALRLQVLCTMCADGLGDQPRAAACLATVCGEVARTGYLRAVLREGAALTPLLREAAQALPGEMLRRQALDLATLLTGHVEAATHTPVFSPRELDVLQHLNHGMQDKVIARRLGVSEHAVRFHLKNIYAKTRVNGRFEAIARARELGVLARYPTNNGS